MSSQSDENVLARAVAENRLTIKADMDFGEMVFHQRLIAPGIVLLRMEEVHIQQRLGRIASLMPILGPIAGRFIVVTETRLRMRPLPAGEKLS